MQMKDAIITGKFALIITMCDALRAITEMEVNGLCVDLVKMEEVKKKYQDLAETTSFNAFNFVHHLGLFEFDFEYNPSLWSSPINMAVHSAVMSSNQSVSHLLFGSRTAKEYKVPVGKNKSGTTKWGKFRQIVHDGIVLPANKIRALTGVEMLKTKSYPVDSTMLELVKHISTAGTTACNVAQALLLYREYEKIHSTYLSPLTSMIRGYNTIHHSLKQTSTATGRLSSSNPNFQNQPNNPDVKGVFIPSHTGAADCFMEFDYKQLEVIAIAYITGDKNLKRDIAAYVDIHTKIGTRVLGHPPSKEERRDIKTIVFAMLYGSGIDNLVATSGKPRALVETVVKEFKAAYPAVFKHHREVLEKLKATAKATGKTDKDTVNLISNTGRSYALPLYRKTTPTGVEYSPSWTQVCNYPCQGFATADIVPMMIATLLDNRDDSPYPYQLRNTVHDSILISCHSAHVEAIHMFVKRILENPYPHLKRLFNITDFDLPLLVEASVGSNWGNTKPLYF
jgi:DNA polymerase-1